MTIDIQSNHYFLRCMVIVDFTMTLIYLREMKDNSMKLVISQVSGNYFGIDYAPNLFAPMLHSFLVNKKKSNKGVNLKAE